MQKEIINETEVTPTLPASRLTRWLDVAELPIGVSANIYDALNKISKPAPFDTRINFFGIEAFVSSDYPKTLDDGTIVDGVMISPNGSKVFLIRGNA